MEYDLKRLVDIYKKHGSIVVGVDFDDTIMPKDDTDEYSTTRCIKVRNLVRAVSEYSKLCLWTVADKQSTRYKVFIAKHVHDIDFDYVNDSPLKWSGNPDKKHFNILLDDVAGLNYNIRLLNAFIDEIEKE